MKEIINEKNIRIRETLLFYHSFIESCLHVDFIFLFSICIRFLILENFLGPLADKFRYLSIFFNLFSLYLSTISSRKQLVHMLFLMHRQYNFSNARRLFRSKIAKPRERVFSGLFRI